MISAKAQSYLLSLTNNESIIIDIENFVYARKCVCSYDLIIINEDINDVVNGVKQQFFSNKDDFKIYKILHSMVHNLHWNNIKPIIRAKYEKDDKILYEKSRIFCKSNKLPVELNDTAYCSVPYTAAIVELSMWDTYNSPVEKLNCLCTTYDIIFAELKSALVTVISKYSEKELEIPIINNEDILPIISLVFMKSKLRHARSNLIYIQVFGEIFLQDNDKRNIVTIFEQIMNKFLEDDFSQSPTGTTQVRDIDFREVIEKLTSENVASQNESNNPSLQEENGKRLLSLILTSTTSNQW